MDNEIKPGYSEPVKDADYTAIAQAVDAHNDAAQTGEHYWGIAMTDGAYTVYEAGKVPPPPTAEELENQLSNEKKLKIAESKNALSNYLASHPILQSDGKYYSVTSEKQSLLTSNLASYQISVALGNPIELTQNSTGDECVVQTYENLATLALAITTYVKPFVSYQQKLEIAINACKAEQDLLAIEISYDTVLEQHLNNAKEVTT